MIREAVKVNALTSPRLEGGVGLRPKTEAIELPAWFKGRNPQYSEQASSRICLTRLFGVLISAG